LRLMALPISGVGSDLLQPITRSVCFFLPWPGRFSMQNSTRSGKFHVEKPHFLDG